MTSRERMRAAIAGEACDRLPWVPELNSAFVQRVLAGVDVPPERQYVEACRRVGGDCLLSVSPATQELRGVEVLQETSGTTTLIRWRTPVGELYSRTETRASAETTFAVEHLIKRVEDVRVYRWVIEHAEVRPSGPAEDPFAPVRHADAVVGDDGILSLTGPATPIMQLLMTDLRAPTMHYLLADHEAEVVALFEAMHAQNRKVYQILAEAPGELVRPFEDTSTTLLSPAMYRRYCQPYLREYGDIVRARGKRFVPHLCGLMRHVLTDLRDTAIDGIEALTPPDTGDTPLGLARQVLGERSVLIGGLDPAWFCHLGPEQMRDRVREVVATLGDGRFTLLGNEEISARANLETVRAVPRTLAEIGPVPLTEQRGR